MVEHLVPLVAQQHCAAGVDIEDSAILLFLDADHHNGLTRVSPVL